MLIKALKPITYALTCALLFAGASETKAQVSNAAALFLRIAPGARAASMGEAFVAVADDATATHWNPAGLGATPLSPDWKEVSFPAEMRPIRGVAAVKSGKGSGYRAYDLWMMTAKGLVRYDNNNWHTSEKFETTTNQTVRKIVSSYLDLTDDALIDDVVDKVAQANFDVSFEYLSSIRDSVLGGLPEDYDAVSELEFGFDSLLISFHLCRLDYDRVQRLQEIVAKSNEDGQLSKREVERINFAVEKARTRFLPEELKLPYAAFFSGHMTSIASNGDVLLVGTENGLLQYTGRRWSRLTTEDGLPHQSVTALHAVGKLIQIGTMNGLATFNGVRINPREGTIALPEGEIEAIGSANLTSIYVVINHDIYHFDGQNWSNSFPYTVQVGDSPEDLTKRMNIFGSEAEKNEYLEKLRRLQPAGSVLNSETGTEGVAESTWFQPGAVVQVPYVGSLTGKVNAMFENPSSDLWLGTEYGVLHFDITNHRWSTPGYRTITVEADETIESLSLKHGLSSSIVDGSNLELLRAVNRIGDGQLKEGQELKIAINPAAAPTYDIARAEFATTFFSTETGLLEYDGSTWSRSAYADMGHGEARQIVSLPDETWYISDKKLATLGQGRMEITVTHVNWLPELADDLFYDFLSGVFNIDGIGTVGLSATFISFGSINRTDPFGNSLGSFESFDAAVAASYGTSLTEKLKGGVSVKVIHSRLADQGAGAEQGTGTSTGFALDLGLLYHWSPKLNLGIAITNIGPKLAYIDAAQADDLPRNLAIGFAYKLIENDFSSLLVTGEMNKIMIGIDDGLSQEIKEMVFNGGLEFGYANLFALRGGYIYDQVGKIKTITLGAGLRFFDVARADFSYIPNSSSQALANTLRLSLSVNP